MYQLINRICNQCITDKICCRQSVLILTMGFFQRNSTTNLLLVAVACEGSWLSLNTRMAVYGDGTSAADLCLTFI